MCKYLRRQRALFYRVKSTAVQPPRRTNSSAFDYIYPFYWWLALSPPKTNRRAWAQRYISSVQRKLIGELKSSECLSQINSFWPNEYLNRNNVRHCNCTAPIDANIAATFCFSVSFRFNLLTFLNQQMAQYNDRS